MKKPFLKLKKQKKKLTTLFSLFFLLFATIAPGYVNAIEPESGTGGIVLTFSGADKTYQTPNVNLPVAITSNKQIDSTSVKMNLDGKAISANFQYKGHEEYDYEYGEYYWVLDSYLEGTVSGTANNLKDGEHILSVTATEINGQTTTKEWKFNVNVKPEFSSANPANGQDTQNNTGFSIKVTDNDGINTTSINVWFDGNLVPASFNSATGLLTYNPEDGFSDGTHTIKLTLQDTTGNTVTYNSTFTVCTTAPILTFEKAGQTLKNNQSLTVAVKSAINLSDSGYTVKLNGQTISSKFQYNGHEEFDDEYAEYYWVVDDYKNGIISFTPTKLSDGIQILEVTANDHLGTSTTQSWNFNVNINPEMGTPLPENGSLTKDNSGFNLKVSDNTSINPDSINATLDGVVIPVAYNSVSGLISYKPTTPLNDGLHKVTLTVEDTSANKSTYSWSYTIITSGPTLDFDKGNQTLTSIPTLTVNIDGKTSLNPNGYTFKIDGQQVNAQFQSIGHWEHDDEYNEDYWVVDDSTNGILTFAPGNLSDGLHTVEVTAKDILGNTTTKSWNFTITMKPEFSILTPALGAKTLDNSGFSVKVVDYNDGFLGSSSFLVKLNGTVVDSQYDQTTKILTYKPQNGLTDGDYTVNIVATDKAGTKSSISWNFTVKSVGIGMTFAENGKTFSSTPSLTFYLQSKNDISQSGFELKIDGIIINPSDYKVTFTGHFEYGCYDEECYESYSNYVVDSYKEATITYRPTSLFGGNHSVTLGAKDVLGNSSSIQGYFSNTGDKNLTLTGPENNAILKASTSISATTNLSRMNVSIKKYGTNFVQNLGDRTMQSSTWGWDTTKIDDGEYTIILTGYDSIGNSVRTQKNVKVANIQEGIGLSNWGSVGNRWGELNLANGNFVASQLDIELPGKGLGTEFSRVYNSQLKTNGVLGWGWRIEVPELAEYSDNSVVITSGTGAKFKYTLNADGTYNKPTGRYEILSKNEENKFELKSKDGKKYIFDKVNNQIIHKDKNGNSVIYKYDSSNRLINFTDSSGRVTTLIYNSSGKVSSVKDYAARTWIYTYDANQNLTKVTNPLNGSMSYTYDSNHQLTSITDANGKKSTFSYSSNKLIGMTDPLNNTTSYSYDTSANKFVEKDPKGNTTTYEYDSNWNIVKITNAEGGVTATTYDENYNVTSITDALNRKTIYKYDSMGNVLSETDPMDNMVTYVYDQNNNLLAKTDAMGSTTIFSYDINGNLLTDGKTVNSYNVDGTVSKISDPKGNESSFTYDSFGNVVKITDALGKVTTFTYNSIGLKVSETDAVGNKTSYTYDSLGRMLTAVSDNANSSQSTTYTYDLNGNRLTAKDEAGNVSSWTYDALNRVLILTEPGGKITKTIYDANGNVTSVTSPDGKVTTYTHDEMNRETKVNYPDGRSVTYTFDKVGNLKKMVDSSGTLTVYEYNDQNLVTKETESTGKITTYTYNPNGQLIGKTVDGIVVGITESYNYTNNNLVSLVSNGVTTNFAYDANNNRINVNYANKTSILYGYDSTNKLTSVINKGTSGNVLSNYTYTYYDNGQIKNVTDSKGVTTYEYDGQNRVTKIINTVGNIVTYTFDEVGNRTSESITVNGVTSTTSFVYEASQLKSISKSDGTTVGYTYDSNGNTLSKTDSSGKTSYEYNSSNQLTKVTKSTGDVIEFVYDGNNKRISKAVNGVVTNYVYNGDSIIQETGVDGKIKASYVYDEKGTPISVKKDGELYNYHYNGHGDVVSLTDSNGNVVSTYEYDLWGNVVAKTGTIDTPFGYAGQYGYVYDQEIGLYFLKSRYYDSEIGRFTTKDRFKGFENRPSSQNQYIYCENNPINNVDPSGYFYVSLNNIGKVLLAIGINPLASVVIGIGLYKLKQYITVKWALLMVRIGSFAGPVGWAVGALASIVSLPSISSVTTGIFDCFLQGKRGIEFGLKYSRWGWPYAIDADAK